MTLTHNYAEFERNYRETVEAQFNITYYKSVYSKS